MSGRADIPPGADPGGRISSAQRGALVASLRRLAPPTQPARQRARPAAAPYERCDLCGQRIPDEHRHLLHLTDRRIICTCEPCWSLRSGDPDLRPAGTRSVWLEGFDLPEEVWAGFQIPIGLAFFFHSSAADAIIALYPSPAGATESELPLEAWERLRAANPVLDGLSPDAEALLVNRMARPAEHAIVPIDRCYALVGLIKSTWEGISGGDAVKNAVEGFFGELRAGAGRP
ncbi:MAG: hypothetical protein QOK40_1920 [Miltoncostaeaceae bacterium]|nr:hypothetical protein [Miltoncostaeaceae bacterium]